MPEQRRPLLLLPAATPVQRARRFGGGSNPRLPPREDQARRLNPKFEALTAAFEAQRVEVAADPAGMAPEQVLVIEIVGSMDEFRRALERAGLEWLGEVDEDDVDAVPGFHDPAKPDAQLSGRLFLTMANERAMQELESLWALYRADANVRFPHGMTPWRDVFARLNDLRRWNVHDRLAETGVLDDWRYRLAHGADVVVAEVELWFRDSDQLRIQAQTRVERLIVEVGGRVRRRCTFPEIAYDALLVELPEAEIRRVLAAPETRLTRCEQVMFFRPCGQVAFRSSPPEDVPPHERAPAPPVRGEPVVAVLDGLPLPRHALLDGHLLVDDPDGWERDYSPGDRVHGTAMASIVVHGDLGDGSPALSRPVYARPILKPNASVQNPPRPEHVPEDELLVDLIHRAVLRLYEAAAGRVGPSVRIINLCVADPSWHFLGTTSPCGRLLDWLSHKYSVVFVVAAGNQLREIGLDVAGAEFAALQPDVREQRVLQAVWRDMRHRTVLSPAEAINALTVGSAHDDASGLEVPATLREPLQERSLASPLSSLGFGPRKAVKPEVLAPGGRQSYRDRLGSNPLVLEVHEVAPRPGVRHASPGVQPAELDRVRLSCGTSNAAAQTSHYLGLAYDELEAMLAPRVVANEVHDRHVAALLRVVAVHAASWGRAREKIDAALRNPQNSRQFKNVVARLLGFGRVAPDRMLGCTSERATALGWGDLADQEAHLYRFPLPPDLSGQATWRRVTVTIAWTTPINPRHRDYRRAALWAGVNAGLLRVARSEVDQRTAQRGATLHEVHEGRHATAFQDGDALEVQVNCRADAGELVGSVPYGIAVTLEVAAGVEVAVYEQVRERLRVPVAVAPRA